MILNKQGGITMRKLNTILVLLVFVLSLIPAAFAEEGSANVAADVETGTDKVSDSSDGATEGMRDKARAAKDAAIKDRAMARDAQGKFENIREHQRNMLMRAIELCSGENIPLTAEQKMANARTERCVDMFTKRLALVAKLTEKDLERLTRITDKQKEHEKDLDDLEADEDFHKFGKEGKARDIAEQKMANARAKFNEAEDKFVKVLSEHKEAREKAAKLKDVLKECETSDTEECKQKLRDHKDEAKRFLLNAADAIIAQLEKIKARVQASEDLSDEEVNELLGRLDAQISEVRDARATIENLTPESSRTDIKEAAKKIRVAWGKIKHDVEKDAEHLIDSRIGGIVVRSKHLETKLGRILAKMAEEGKDTSAVESLVADFNAALDEAKQHYEDALAKYKEFKDNKDESTLKQAQDLRNQAHESLKKAHETLKKIFKTLKAQGKERELEADDENEVEDKAEEETAETETSEGTEESGTGA